MIEFLFQMEDLFHWMDFLTAARHQAKADQVDALNAAGEALIRNIAADVSQQTGLDPEKVRNLINTKPATETNPEFVIDASKVTNQAFMADRRRWPKGRTGVIRPGTLVNIITMEDDKVCQKCQDAHEEGPYDLETAKQMLPLHPHCRCLIWTAESIKRVGVTFQKAGERPTTEPMTMRQLAENLIAGGGQGSFGALGMPSRHGVRPRGRIR